MNSLNWLLWWTAGFLGKCIRNCGILCPKSGHVHSSGGTWAMEWSRSGQLTSDVRSFSYEKSPAEPYSDFSSIPGLTTFRIHLENVCTVFNDIVLTMRHLIHCSNPFLSVCFSWGDSLELNWASPLRMIFTLLACRHGLMRMQNARDFPQTKLDSKI